MTDKRIKVSVEVITYNQEKTISQTIESILMQQGDFDLEIVIGEDCGTDNTLAICHQYEKKYPNIINVLDSKENLGIMANFSRTIQACTGDYICDISGDDYYCDNHAIEKQLSFMIANPEVGVMGANGYYYYVRRNKYVAGLNRVVAGMDNEAKNFFFNSSYRGGPFFRPVGLMFQRDLLKYIDLDEFIRRKLPVEDYPMQAILSQYTKFACLPDLLVVYRVYNTSATFVSISNPKYVQYYKGLMDIRRYMNELFPDDICITEEKLLDIEFYRQYQVYLHNLEYKKALKLINSQTKSIFNQPHFLRARKMTTSHLKFILFHAYKEIIYIKERFIRT